LNKLHLSPLLLSSLQMLEHAIEHLKMGTEKDRGFAVLHADNAVELILKELARLKGIRIIGKKRRFLELLRVYRSATSIRAENT